MKVKHLEVELRQNETQTNVLLLPAWEVPVLEAVWGKNSVTVKSEKQVVRKIPDAASEFERLRGRYKEARDESGAKSEPFVAMVYGNFATGLRNLQNAITEACGSFVGAQQPEFSQPAQRPFETVQTVNEGPAAQVVTPAAEKPKRTRRTKAQIEADKAAKELAADPTAQLSDLIG